MSFVFERYGAVTQVEWYTMSIELLSPAGSHKAMNYAFAYGADAVYAGQPRYSLRVRENEFSKIEKIAAAVEYAHRLGKRFYIASNIAPHNNKVRTYLADMEPVIAMGPDALIMSDPGLIMMVRERWPEMPVHLSVQANTVNYAAVKFWQSLGLKRIILSRELSLDEIEEIRQQCPDMELEVFVHGALCIAYSGRCLLSGYMTHRDSNQGACTNSCRWKYQAHEAKTTMEGDVVTDQVYLLQERGRPDQLMPAYEDEHGTYIMNSKDLRAVQHVRRLMDMGIESLKIEGRTKSYLYTARTAQVYHQAIVNASAGRDLDLQLMDDLESLASRGYTEGFYRRHVRDELQNYEQGNSTASEQRFAGEITGTRGGMLIVDVKNRFAVGDEMELMTPSGNTRFRLKSITSQTGGQMVLAPGSGHIVLIPSPSDHCMEHALLMRSFATISGSDTNKDEEKIECI